MKTKTIKTTGRRYTETKGDMVFVYQIIGLTTKCVAAFQK
jgi:hypothetical protein